MVQQQWTLRGLAEIGYCQGLGTIGEAASSVEQHYDAWFLIENLVDQMKPFYDCVRGHESESIDLHLTDEQKQKLDEDMEKAVGRSCCDNESRNMNGGCDNCGDPCL